MWDRLPGNGSREAWSTGTQRKALYTELQQDDPPLIGHELLQVLKLLSSTHYFLRSEDIKGDSESSNCWGRLYH